MHKSPTVWHDSCLGRKRNSLYECASGVACVVSKPSVPHIRRGSRGYRLCRSVSTKFQRWKLNLLSTRMRSVALIPTTVSPTAGGCIMQSLPWCGDYGCAATYFVTRCRLREVGFSELPCLSVTAWAVDMMTPVIVSDATTVLVHDFQSRSPEMLYPPHAFRVVFLTRFLSPIS